MNARLSIDWLRQINSGIATRQLYSGDHPRVVAAVSRLAELTDLLIDGRAEVSLLVVEGRLVCDGEVVPGADAIADRVFRQVHAHGYHRVTLRLGTTGDELSQLMTMLGAASPEPGTLEALQSTPHIGLSALDGSAPPPKGGLADSLAASGVALQALWQPIDAQRAIDRRALDRILAPLVETLDGPPGTLPLAALASHDEYTATHITNVALLTMALAQAVGLPSRAVREVGIAALLHDIGKMRIPAEILAAPGRLTPEQLAVIRRHPEIGARLLVETPGVPHLAVVVAYEHHLQADGGGYPDVPHGWQVGLVSSMTHVADVYDALRTNRPYRLGLPHDAILDMMMRDRGTVFSAPLLDAFFEQVVPRTSAGSGNGASAGVAGVPCSMTE